MNNDFFDNYGGSTPDDDFFSKSANGDTGLDPLFDDELGFSDFPGDTAPDSSGDGFDDGFDDDFSDDFADESADEVFTDDSAERSAEPSAEPSADDPADDFTDDFADDFSDDFADDSADVPSDDFADFTDEDDALDEVGNDEFDYSDIADEKKRASSDRFITAKLAVVVVAIVFAVGLLFFIKLTNGSLKNDHTVSDSENASPSDYVQSAEDNPSGETSSQEAAVSSEEKPAYRELEYKEKSEDVKKMQRRLYELGYIAPSSCTGFFGDYTVKNLKRFQKAAGLEPTGKADSETLEKLYSDDAPKAR